MCFVNLEHFKQKQNLVRNELWGSFTEKIDCDVTLKVCQKELFDFFTNLDLFYFFIQIYIQTRAIMKDGFNLDIQEIWRSVVRWLYKSNILFLIIFIRNTWFWSSLFSSEEQKMVQIDQDKTLYSTKHFQYRQGSEELKTDENSFEIPWKIGIWVVRTVSVFYTLMKLLWFSSRTFEQ